MSIKRRTLYMIILFWISFITLAITLFFSLCKSYAVLAYISTIVVIMIGAILYYFIFFDRKSRIRKMISEALDSQKKEYEEEISNKEKEFIIKYDEISKKLTEITMRSDSPQHRFFLEEKVFGYSFEQFKHHFRIKNDGSSSISYNFWLNAFDKLEKISLVLKCPSFICEEENCIYTYENGIKEMKYNNITITPTIKNPSIKNVELDIEFNPPLKNGDSIQYYFTYNTPAHTFSLDQKELQKRGIKTEYASFHNLFPIKLLNFSISFEYKYKFANQELYIYKDRAQNIDHEQINSLVSNNDFNPYSITDDGLPQITLNVKNPVIGMFYYIRWIPKNK